jgi:alpha-1,6-mannosyltransferase
MRIAHIANMYGPKSGGLRTTMNELSEEYARRGNQILLIYPGETDSHSVVGLVSRVTIAGPKIPLSGGYRIILRPKKVIEKLIGFNPEVIEISDRTTLLKVSRWAQNEKIPSTFFAHERVDGIVRSFFKYLPFQHFLVQRWNQVTRDSVDRIVATTNFAAQEFLDLGVHHGDTPQSKLTTVPLGVNLGDFDSRLRGGVIKSEVTLPKKYILACTRLSKEKDPLFLLEIAAEIKARNIEATLVIAGSGPLEEKMRKLIEKKALDVTLLGFISDRAALSQIMSGAQAFLAVGPIETFGLAALETLASGTPVICRAEAAISEIIDGNSGRALGRSAPEWVNAIIELQNQNRQAMRDYSRSRAESFTWEKTAEQLLNLYRWDLAK